MCCPPLPPNTMLSCAFFFCLLSWNARRVRAAAGRGGCGRGRRRTAHLLSTLYRGARGGDVRLDLFVTRWVCDFDSKQISIHVALPLYLMCVWIFLSRGGSVISIQNKYRYMSLSHCTLQRLVCIVLICSFVNFCLDLFVSH